MISQLIEPQNEVSLLYGMLLIRRIEEALIAEYPKQEMRCPVHFSIGQEAIAVGVSSNLATQTCLYVFSRFLYKKEPTSHIRCAFL